MDDTGMRAHFEEYIKQVHRPLVQERLDLNTMTWRASDKATRNGQRHHCFIAYYEDVITAELCSLLALKEIENRHEKDEFINEQWEEFRADIKSKMKTIIEEVSLVFVDSTRATQRLNGSKSWK